MKNQKQETRKRIDEVFESNLGSNWTTMSINLALGEIFIRFKRVQNEVRSRDRVHPDTSRLHFASIEVEHGVPLSRSNALSGAARWNCLCERNSAIRRLQASSTAFDPTSIRSFLLVCWRRGGPGLKRVVQAISLFFSLVFTWRARAAASRAARRQRRGK